MILIGDEPDAGEAVELGVEHLSDLALNDLATPRLDHAFRQVEEVARHPLRCFVNADIVLLPDLLPAVELIARSRESFLLVGQTRDLEISGEEILAPDALRRRALAEGRLRGPTAVDWFVFPAGLFEGMPPFMVGRAAFDNWMIWHARRRGLVVDATDCIVAIHQPHDYAHLQGGKDEAYYGVEADENRRLAGGKRNIYTLHDTSHWLTVDLELRRNLSAPFRWRERTRKAAWKLGLR